MAEQTYSLEFVVPLGVVMLAGFIWWKWQNSPRPIADPAVPPEAPIQPPAQPHTDSRAEVTLRLVLPSGQTHTCTLPGSSTIAQLKARVFPGEAENIILIYMGRRLQNDFTIDGYHLPADSVLHAQRAAVPQDSQDLPGEASPVAFIFVGVLLASLWVLMLQFPDLFEGFSKVMLVVLTGLWGVFAKSWLSAYL